MSGAGPSRWLASAACALLFAGCAPLPPATPPPPSAGAAASSVARQAPAAEQPEVGSGWTPRPTRHFKRFAVATAHPLASEAGAQVLRDGGNAVDAAVAVQMVLALVEPQSSGLGGGAFLVLHTGGKTLAYDGRETAPAAATEDLFLDAGGRPLPFGRALVGGRAVGVPGAVAMLELAHRAHGRLPWARLLAPAIRLAREGFPVSPRLHASLAADSDLRKDAAASGYFFSPDGKPWPVGHRLRNPEMAAALEAIAAQGARGLMDGEFAQAMVQAVRSHPGNPGRLAVQDLRDYRPLQREATCFVHRAPPRAWRLCGMPPPSSGALALGQVLGMLEHQHPASALDALHRYAEASRLAFADRAQYVADPDFVQPPAGGWDALLAPAYLASRAARITPGRMPGPVPAGEPGGQRAAYAAMQPQPEHGTSHISILDAEGNALAMTTSVEAAFGARLMVNRGAGLTGGFLLNNELTDFSFEPRGADGRPVANRVQPGKRPRSSMAPTLVFDASTGEPVASVGSAGGPFIIHFVAHTLLGLLDEELTPADAVARPWLGTIGGDDLFVERGRWPVATLDGLRALGHPVREIGLPSGTQVVVRERGGLAAAADPRRDGSAAGD